MAGPPLGKEKKAAPKPAPLLAIAEEQAEAAGAQEAPVEDAGGTPDATSILVSQMQANTLAMRAIAENVGKKKEKNRRRTWIYPC